MICVANITHARKKQKKDSSLKYILKKIKEQNNRDLIFVIQKRGILK